MSLLDSFNFIYNAGQSIDQLLVDGLSCSCCDDEPHFTYALRKIRFFTIVSLCITCGYVFLFILCGLLLPYTKAFKKGFDVNKELDVKQRFGAFVHASIMTICSIFTFYYHWNFIWSNPVFGSLPRAFAVFANTAGYLVYDVSVELLFKPSSKWRKDILFHHVIYFVSTYIVFLSCGSCFLTMIGCMVVIADAVNHALFLNYTFEYNLEKILVPIKEFMVIFRLVIPNVPIAILGYDMFITGNIYRLHEKGRGILAVFFLLIMGIVTFAFSYFWTPKKKRQPQHTSTTNKTHRTNNTDH